MIMYIIVGSVGFVAVIVIINRRIFEVIHTRVPFTLVICVFLCLIITL